MYATLLGARRFEALELSQQAERCRAELRKAQEEIAEYKARIAHLQSEVVSKQLSATVDSE